MKSWGRTAFVVSGVLASIAVLAHERHGKVRAPASARAAPNPLVATHLENGGALFRDYCASCHGADGKGNGVPSIPSGPLPTDLTDEKMLGMTDGEVHWIIGQGIPESGMPGFAGEMSERERWQVALYVRDLWSRSGTEAEVMDVTVRFQGQVGGREFSCGGEYAGIGKTRSTVTPMDFRFYAHGFRLVGTDGSEVPLELEQDGKWQLDDLALLDFEDGSGPCANGTSERNVTVRGRAPAGSYRGLRFFLGVPFARNHRDPTNEPSPLDLTQLFWVWNAGYKFARLDMKTTGNPRGYFIHLGSTGCTPNETVNTLPTSCDRPNRPEIELADFDVHRDVVVADLASLLETSDLDSRVEKRFQGCMSSLEDPQCRPILSAFGIDVPGLGPDQKFFRRDGGAETSADFAWNLPKGFPVPRVPGDNPMNASKVELGRRLFYDTRLSVTGEFSCASCHEQRLAFTDGRGGAVGATGEVHPRGSMSLANVAYSPVYTWGNPNIRTLENQALGPMFGEDPVELGLAGHEKDVLGKLRSEPKYQKLFPESFPGDPDPFTIARITQAIAAFERTLVSGGSPYDRYRYGGDREAISESAKRGEKLFFSEKLECFHCHGGFNFAGPADYAGKTTIEVEFHNTGLYNLGGRGDYPKPNTGVHSVSGAASDMGHFKAPTLRNVAVTAPYMHDGSIATLDEVVDHYAAGGRGGGVGSLYKSGFVRGFELRPEERRDLIEFLGSLTDEEFLRDPRFSDPWPGEDR